MFGTFNWGALAVIVITMGILVVKTVCIVVLGFWIFSRTRWGQGLMSRRAAPTGGVTLEVGDQLRAMQAQLEELHARVDFTERLLVDQRDQLRALGVEPPHESLQPTPV
jgi:hypothetical protein